MLLTCLAISAMLLQNPPGREIQQEPVQHKSEVTKQAPATSEKPAVVNNPTAAEKQNNTNEQWKWWPPPSPWDIYWPTWILVFITGFAVKAAIKTLESINAQVDEMRKTGEQTDKLIAENIAQSKSMQLSVAEAARLASAMEVVSKEIAVSSKAAMASVTAINQQMRAYLCVVIGTALYQDRAKNLKFQTVPSIVNAGLTPAHKVSFSASAAILPAPLPADFTFPLPAPTSGTSVIGPRQNITVTPVVEDFCDDSEIEGIKHAAQGKALYTWGIFTYEDIFGNPQYTKFCQIYTWLQDGKTTWGYYADRHNDAS
jgi:hypothetical protein